MVCGVLSEEDFLNSCRNDAQTLLDLVFDYADAGFNEDAAKLLEMHLAHPVADCAVPNPSSRSAMCLYVLAWLKQDGSCWTRPAAIAGLLFPSRLHEQIVLEWALQQPARTRWRRMAWEIISTI